MACGCNRNNSIARPRRTTIPRQTAIARQVAKPSNAGQIKAQAVVKNNSSSERKTIEKKRREAIFRRLGRI